MSKAKISDVRQGVTLYYVHAFPHKGVPSSINTLVVTKKPFKSKHSGGTFSEAVFHFEDDFGKDFYTRQWSLSDGGIIANKYNFHKTFTSMKAAKRYAARMDRVCLTAAERKKFDKKIEDVRMFAGF